VKAETSSAYEKPEQVQERFGLRHGYHSHDNAGREGDHVSTPVTETICRAF
jgi:hypothetical protein